MTSKKKIETSLKRTILELEVQLNTAMQGSDFSKASAIKEQKEKLGKHLQDLISLESPEGHEELYLNRKDSPAQNTHQTKDFDSLKFYLQKLAEEGKNGSFFILTLDDSRNYYFQFFSPDGSPTVIIEAVGNSVLSANDKLSAEKITVLEQEGWILPINDAPNLQLTFDYQEEDVSSLIKKLKRVAQKVYGVQIGREVDLSLNFE